LWISQQNIAWCGHSRAILVMLTIARARKFRAIKARQMKLLSLQRSRSDL
jgi:hypothetical protein